jgi:NADH:ubiquinone oxidoreductase subunit F (NADH-binding)
MKKNIIGEIKKHNLTGRGGASFPTATKWEAVKAAKGKKKYVVCNGSEGEPGIYKDGYILESYPEYVVEGMVLALEAVGGTDGVLYLNHDYYKRFKTSLEKIVKKAKAPIIVFKKYGGYVAGDETVVCNVIEGKVVEPRQKPPFPAQSGVFDCPTLINNVETFYNVAQIARGEYSGERCYTILGDIKKPGVYELSETMNMEDVLKATGNYPKFEFFVQAGGGASGDIFVQSELNKPLHAAGSLIVYNKKKTNLYKLMEEWATFFDFEDCDRCAPCREGAYRMLQMVKSKKIDKRLLEDLTLVLEQTSFCPLGKSIPTPFKSLVEKVLIKK